MPTKQIYVKKEDLALFEKAEKFGNDNFSKFVMEALREYVKQQEKKMDSDGFSQIDLEVGRFLPLPEKIAVKRIRGKQIACHEVHDYIELEESKYSVYLTKKGNFVFWCRSWNTFNEEQDEEGNYIPQETAEFIVLDQLPDIPEENGIRVEEFWIPRDLLMKAHIAIDDDDEDIEELDV